MTKDIEPIYETLKREIVTIQLFKIFSFCFLNSNIQRGSPPTIFFINIKIYININ